MKITFYTEESYGYLQIGEYEFIPIHNMDETEEITLKITDIIEELPTMFKKMGEILKADENFQKCLERRPEMNEKYKKSNHYNFYYKNTKLIFNAKFVLTHNLAKPKKKLWNFHYVKEDSVVEIIVRPEKCTICQDAFINKIETDAYTIYECLKCSDKQKKWAEDYEEKKKNIDNYYPWNNFLCDDCESFEHECRNCRNFYKGTY